MSSTTYSDTKQKANIALLEVEKGLRSSSVGEQSEAIVQLPSLIEQYPFPVLINNAYLKLAEVFRTGSNLLRLHVLKVIQLSKRHLNKLTNSDEFLKRINTVTHSNDAVARAIVLRVFGCIAAIISERKNVHHSIRRGLESNDMIEVEAAIFAVNCFCQYSKNFSAAMCEKIADMVQGLSTPLEMKLKLISILGHMHHDLHSASQARQLCVQLLSSYASLAFVCTILQTLTKLAVATLVHVSDQLNLLSDYARQDPRRTIRLTALTDLQLLAKKTPHLWDLETIKLIVQEIESMPSGKETELMVKVLLILSNEITVHQLVSLKDQIQQICYHENLNMAALACGVYVNVTMVMLSSHAHDEDSKYMCQETAELIVSTIVALSGSVEPPDTSILKVLLTAAVKLSSKSDVGCSIVSTILHLLPQLSVEHASLMGYAMAAITSRAPAIFSFGDTSSELLSLVQKSTELNCQLLLPLSAVFMALSSRDVDQETGISFVSQVEPVLLDKLWNDNQQDYWLCYKVARQASYMGFHSLACKIYNKLSEKVMVHHYRYWLMSLMQISASQILISQSTSFIGKMVDDLSETSSLLHQAILLMKASSLSSTFPLQFLTLYASLIDAHMQLVATCVRIQTAPVSSEVIGNPIEKLLQMCVDEFHGLSNSYADLYSSLFDADPHTLSYIEQLQQSCVLMTHVISSIALSRKPLVSPARLSTPTTDKASHMMDVPSNSFNVETPIGRSCMNVLRYAQNCTDLQSLPISGEHVAAISHCSKTLLQVPLLLPKYFFNRHQQTSIKLAISPSTSESDKSVTVVLGTLLTLSIEGVIEHSKIVDKYRRISSAYVTVTPEVKEIIKISDSVIKIPELVKQEKQEIVQGGYFKAQFLFDFPTAAYYTLLIQASIIDDAGVVKKYLSNNSSKKHNLRNNVLVRKLNEFIFHIMPPTIITEIEEAEKELEKCRKRLNEVEGNLRYEENERQKGVLEAEHATLTSKEKDYVEKLQLLRKENRKSLYVTVAIFVLLFVIYMLLFAE